MIGSHLSVSSNGFLDEAWSFNAGAAIGGSPAVVNAVAYIGDAAGHVYAVSVPTGMEDWLYQAPSGAAIDTTPAVDGGQVFVGTSLGTLIAVERVDRGRGLDHHHQPPGSRIVAGGGRGRGLRRRR